MNAPRADANKSMADVEKTAVSLSGVLKGMITYYRIKKLTVWTPILFNAGSRFMLCLQGSYDTCLVTGLR
jgi:hypothetical protein